MSLFSPSLLWTHIYFTRIYLLQHGEHFFPYCLCLVLQTITNVLHAYFYAIYRTVSFRALLQRENRRTG